MKKKNRPAWYYKPCPVPPKIEYDIDGLLDAQVWFQHRWENDEIVKGPYPSGISLADMVSTHFTVNVHTGSIDFFTGWIADHWGTVRLHDHSSYSLGTGLWLNVNDESRLECAPITQDTSGVIYDPLWERWRIFVLENDFLGSTLPPNAQQEYLTAGLARDLYPDRLEEAIAQYAESHPYLDLTAIVRIARIERERMRLAAIRHQRQTRSKTDPRQQSMF